MRVGKWDCVVWVNVCVCSVGEWECVGWVSR